MRGDWEGVGGRCAPPPEESAKTIGHFVCETLIQFKAALYEHKVCNV